jgi:hypothetical protein
VIVDLIAATTTKTGLKVYARLDENDYPTGLKVTDEQLAAANITGDEWHPDWNYRVTSHARSP